MLNEETWFTGKEAVDASFADKLSESKRTDNSMTKWDLSLFDNAPETGEVEESEKRTPLSLLIRRQALHEKTLNQE